MTVALVLVLLWFVGVPLGVVALAALYSRRAGLDPERSADALTPSFPLAAPREPARVCERRTRSRRTPSVAARRGRRAA